MNLESVIKLIVDKFKPYSIFLYGSKATKTDTIFSDYELGIIFEDENFVSRKELNEFVNDNKYSIFPFKLSEINKGIIDTPFQREIYLNTLINGGAKPLYGVKVLENLTPPQITREHLLAEINFNLGIALSAVKAYKEGNYKLANELFYKSCLFLTRDYIYYKFKKLCITYNEIYEFACELKELSEFKDLVKISYNLRSEIDNKINEEYYYENISYINKFLLIELNQETK